LQAMFQPSKRRVQDSHLQLPPSPVPLCYF
jgi:hypothetical protein